VTFTENIWRQFRPMTSDRKTAHHAHQRAGVRGLRAGLFDLMEGTPIYELVSSAYQVPLVGAFVPLVFGLYWKRPPPRAPLRRGAGHRRVAVVHGHAGLNGFSTAAGWSAGCGAGMLAGSLLPQWITNRRESGALHLDTPVVGSEPACAGRRRVQRARWGGPCRASRRRL
jgi:Na+/proline symporter